MLREYVFFALFSFSLLGQFYNINVKDTESIDVDITSTIKITFHDESHRKVASNYWKFWMSQQKHGQARAIDIG